MTTSRVLSFHPWQYPITGPWRGRYRTSTLSLVRKEPQPEMKLRYCFPASRQQKLHGTLLSNALLLEVTSGKRMISPRMLV
jgi:hypothetical protein